MLMKIIASVCLHARSEPQYNLMLLFFKASSGRTENAQWSLLAPMREAWKTLQHDILPGLLGLRFPHRKHYPLSQ